MFFFYFFNGVQPTNPGRVSGSLESLKMGYRELLKKYILHLEIVVGENFIDQQTKEPVLSERDIGELQTLAAEIHRGAFNASEETRAANYNARLRVLMNQYGLSPADLANITETETDVIARWRTSPNSDRYLAISESEFAALENALLDWLEC